MDLFFIFQLHFTDIREENNCLWFVWLLKLHGRLMPYVNYIQRAELVFVKFRERWYRWTWSWVGTQHRTWCFVQSLVIFAELALKGAFAGWISDKACLSGQCATTCYFFSTSHPFRMLLGPLLLFLPSSN